MKELSIDQKKLRGTSDTEIVLETIERLGVQKAVQKLNGMFAIALWDQKERKLYLLRDRVGKKPLYYAFIDKCLVFGSELKAIIKFPGFSKKINNHALKKFLHLSYIPGEETIYENVYKLKPGSIVTFSPEHISNYEKKTYWSFSQIVMETKNNPDLSINDENVMNQFETLLFDSVEKRMISDVPLGSFLSGGIDSTLITAVMQRLSSNPIKTFTIGFKEKEYNEANNAKKIAQYIGSDHTELYISCNDLIELVPKLCDTFDEPFADPSQLPTFMVSNLARTKVTVALSGDGGDELFAGYNRYLSGISMWNRLGKYPEILRKFGSEGIGILMPLITSIYPNAHALLPENIRHRNMPDKLNKIKLMLESGSIEEMYYKLINNWNFEQGSIIDDLLWNDMFSNDSLPVNKYNDVVHWMMGFDFLNYLPEDILTKVDRTSMAVSLETRAPLLDYRIVEFAWSLPLTSKARNGERKWPLRKLVEKFLPDMKMERPKTGFDIPIGEWLRNELKDWAHDLLKSCIDQDPVLDPLKIKKAWNAHLAGQEGFTKSLWNVLTYLNWKNRWL